MNSKHSRFLYGLASRNSAANYRAPSSELQMDVVWNSTYMLSFLGKNVLPVYVHRTSTNPPVTIEDISMFPGSLVEASVSQVTRR